MLPNRSLGLLAFIVFAFCVIALSFMAFTSAASAASVGGRPYRGYADLCVSGAPMRCGSAQTIAVFDSKRECERVVAEAIAEYRAAQSSYVFVQTQCRFSEFYDA